MPDKTRSRHTQIGRAHLGARLAHLTISATKSLALGAVIAFSALSVRAQPTLDALALAQLPSWSQGVLDSPAFRQSYLFDLSINPFVQSGDFDGDGFLDLAVLVREVSSGRRGVALILQDGSAPFILGAGQAGDDFSWLVLWHMERRLPAGAGLSPAGDILIASGFDGARLWLFRDAEGWRWIVP